VDKFLSSVSFRHSTRRTAALAVGLLLTAGFGLADSPEASSQPHKSAVRVARGIQPLQSFACTTLGINCNSTVTGALTADDCKVDPPDDDSLYDAYTFQATAGQTIQITMQSTAFDTYLYLFDPSGTGGFPFDENNNYPGGGTNSRISFTVPSTGTYTIWANSNTLTPVTGAYSLELVCSGSQPPSGTVTLPAAASLHGAPPTFFHSDVSVFNPSATQPATVTARYRCFTGACGVATQTFTVAPRQLRVFDDIVGTFFAAPETGGAVEFTGNVLVDSRLYTPSRPAPTVGMYVPGLSAAEAYAEAVVTSLSFSANLSTGFRTNVGVYNGNDVAQTVTFTLFNPQGVQIGQTSQLVPARTPLQINNIAGFVGITTDVPSFYVVVRGNGTSKNYVYAAVLDNQSQDLIFVKGANNAAVPSGTVTLPAAASLHGAPPTFFHSDVSVFNPSATQPATVTARYRCFTGACGNAVQTFTVAPRQLRVFDDIVGTLFGAPETGGAVEFTGNVLVDSRLYTPSRPAPTVGMYVPGLSAAEAYAEAVVTSLSFSANLSTGFRTNVGVYNGNDVAQTVTFTLFNPQGVQIGQTSQLVPARTPLQINNIVSFVGITTDVPSFYVVVRGNGTSKNYVYAAVLDNQSQDLIFVKGAQAQSP
jgi:hypothetical protein